jgi:hypothetical protein
MPFDDLAADQEPCPSNSRAGVCACELLDLPHDSELDDGNIRPQHDGIPAHQWARECGLHFVSHQQQLQFDDCAD